MLTGDNWYVKVQGQDYGPYSTVQMQDFITEGRIIASSFVSMSPNRPFRPASEFSAFNPGHDEARAYVPQSHTADDIYEQDAGQEPLNKSQVDALGVLDLRNTEMSRPSTRSTAPGGDENIMPVNHESLMLDTVYQPPVTSSYGLESGTDPEMFRVSVPMTQKPQAQKPQAQVPQAQASGTHIPREYVPHSKISEASLAYPAPSDYNTLGSPFHKTQFKVLTPPTELHADARPAHNSQQNTASPPEDFNAQLPAAKPLSITPPTTAVTAPTKVPSPDGVQNMTDKNDMGVLLVMAEFRSGQAMGFLQALQKQGTAQRIGDTVWLLRTEITVNALRNILSQTMKREDRLFILDSFNNKTAWFNIGSDMDRRIREFWNMGTLQ